MFTWLDKFEFSPPTNISICLQQGKVTREINDMAGTAPEQKRPRENSDDEVSDGESLSGSNIDDIDELLSLGDKDPEQETEIILADRQCDSGVDMILTKEYGGAPLGTFAQCNC